MSETAGNPKELPEQIELTEVEMLRAENIDLKRSALQAQMSALSQEAAVFKDSVQRRLGIDDLDRYLLNRKTGDGRLARKNQS